MSTPLFRRVLLASVCTVAFAAPAMAQSAADDNGKDAEIVVTAQNRTQSVKDVPIAIDVVNGEALKEKGFSGMDQIDKVAPVVQLNQDQGTVKVTVRGIGTNSNDESQDTSVVVNIDGEYINRPEGMSAAMFDIDRVEVLRGPQGTLYGRNSTGGAINFITRKPGNDFAVNGSASYGNYNAVRLDAGVDVPMGETAAVRVAGFYEERDGYVSHPARPAFAIFPAYVGGKTDDNQAYGGRVSVKLEPTSRLSVNLAAEYGERHFSPATFAYVDMNSPGNGPTGPGCNANGYTQVATAYSQTLCIPNNTNFLSTVDRSNYATPFYGTGHKDQKTYAVRGRIAYELSDNATVTYTGGYRHFAETSDLKLPTIYQSYGFENTFETQSHELRVNGKIGGVIYQVGGFYFREKQYHEVGFFLAPIAYPAGTFLTYFGRDIKSQSLSGFGQVEVPLGDKLTLVGGLRYTDNKRDALYINGSPFVMFDPTGSFPIGGPNFALLGAGSGRKDLNAINAEKINYHSSENKVTWLAGVNLKPNDDTLLYAKVSTGFKGGGFDAVGTYRPETNTAYEAGWKQTFGDHGQFQFNASAFYYDYRDLQVSVLLDTTKGGQTFNAGKATIKGLELSGDFKITDNDTFHASVNYLNARYDELLAQFNVYTVPGTGSDVNGIGDLDPVAPGVQQPNFAGHRPPFSPEFIVTAGYEHVFDLGSAGSVTAGVNTTLKSSYFLDFYNYRDGKQEGFTQTDLTLTYKPENGRFTVQGFARNLENIRPLTYGSFISAGPDDIWNWQFGTPRTYGVRVSVEY